mmetsp:Transcript_4847/g.9790  ORF Transcript_4847/g.9790 Transcript_4847/m.9790 type:complete len:247 (-) Transcript_4847:1004-1744(-)
MEGSHSQMEWTVDEVRPLLDGAPSRDDGNDELVEDEVQKAGKQKKKEKKNKKKKSTKGVKDDDLKTHMQNERTFFKWLFFGFHVGGLGTFILTFFASSAPFRSQLVLLVWLVAFFFIYYGLFRYFQRRRWVVEHMSSGVEPHCRLVTSMTSSACSALPRSRALRLGLTDPAEWDDPWGPLLMTLAFVAIVGGIMVYAVVACKVRFLVTGWHILPQTLPRLQTDDSKLVVHRCVWSLVDVDVTANHF